MRGQSGFTLIELIAVLVIVGILATVAPLFLTVPVQGYVGAREQAAMSYTGELALARLREDLRLATVVQLTNAQTLQLTLPTGTVTYLCDTASLKLLRNSWPVATQIKAGACQFALDTAQQWVKVDLTLLSDPALPPPGQSLTVHDTISYRRTW